MRSNPSEYELVAPGSLRAVVSLLATEPGMWLPIAGGTDVMVQYAAGKLPARKLVSIWNLPELRAIEVAASEIRIGAGNTYTDIRRREIIRADFPLLYSAACWTGAVANQNRGTIGGNIVNASPAADSLPALLAYDSDLILVSARGERRVPYAGFHTGYKKTLLAQDELVQSICLPRSFSNYFVHARKVGARNAQAISKVCIAAAGRTSDGIVEDVRIALGSVAPVPLRLTETEKLVAGRAIEPHLLAAARRTVVDQIRPIDDIRSSTKYRSTVAGNLVVEFLQRLQSFSTNRYSVTTAVLEQWNRLPADLAIEAILPCCGSRAWAEIMVARRPYDDSESVLTDASGTWRNLAHSDWLEAFRAHPRIGESRAENAPPTQSVQWSAQEQRDAGNADNATKIALANANREYEVRFERTFIVCATGKSATEILEILRRRLKNDAQSELNEAAEQQRQISEIRLKKWLQA